MISRDFTESHFSPGWARQAYCHTYEHLVVATTIFSPHVDGTSDICGSPHGHHQPISTHKGSWNGPIWDADSQS